MSYSTHRLERIAEQHIGEPVAVAFVELGRREGGALLGQAYLKHGWRCIDLDTALQEPGRGEQLAKIYFHELGHHATDTAPPWVDPAAPRQKSTLPEWLRARLQQRYEEQYEQNEQKASAWAAAKLARLDVEDFLRSIEDPFVSLSNNIKRLEAYLERTR